jgi:hypothetical protein
MWNHEIVRTERSVVGAKRSRRGVRSAVAVLVLGWLTLAGTASAQEAGAVLEMRALKCHALAARVARYGATTAEHHLRVCETLDRKVLDGREPSPARLVWHQEMRDVKAAAREHRHELHDASLAYAEEMREIKLLARDHRPSPGDSLEATAH